jgi:hypothetical protein
VHPEIRHFFQIDGIKTIEAISKQNRPHMISDFEFKIIKVVINSMKLGSYHLQVIMA